MSTAPASISPTWPEGDTYKHRVRIKSYSVIEKAGLIWVYMGPEAQKPPFYQFEWLDTPDSHRFMQKLIVNCNYFQSMEGDFDASHAPFLHRTLDDNRSNLSARIRENNLTYEDLMPTYELADTAYGNIFGAVRKQADGNQFRRRDALDHAVLHHARRQPAGAADELPRARG